jgi:hypothetical protein
MCREGLVLRRRLRLLLLLLLLLPKLMNARAAAMHSMHVHLTVV